MGGESTGGPASSEADDHQSNFICGVVEGLLNFFSETQNQNV